MLADIIERRIVLVHLHERCICDARSGMAFQTDYIQAIHTTTLDFLDGASVTSSPDLQIKQEDISNDDCRTVGIKLKQNNPICYKANALFSVM